MSKASQQQVAADEAAQDAGQAQPLKLSLHEFCARLSMTVRRPELIGGFEHHERINGHLEDTEAGFQASFSSFRNKPV